MLSLSKHGAGFFNGLVAQQIFQTRQHPIISFHPRLRRSCRQALHTDRRSTLTHPFAPR